MKKSLVLVLLLAYLSCALDRGVSLKPFATSDPGYYHIHNKVRQQPLGYWGVIERPYPTNSWFMNLGFPSMPVMAFPYVMKPIENGIVFCYSALVAQPRSFTSSWSEDIWFWIDYMQNRTIMDHTMLGVTTQWTTIAGEYLLVPWVQGNPYVTLKFSYPVFNISTTHFISTINGIEPLPFNCTKAEKFKVSLQAVNPDVKQIWLIYSLTGPIELCYYPDGRDGPEGPRPVLFGRSEQSDTVLRITILPSDDAESILDEYINTIVVGGDVNIDTPVTADNKTKIIFNWKVKDLNWEDSTSNDVLMLAQPHHNDCIDTKNVTGPILKNSFRTIRGPMTGYVGNRWTLIEQLTNVGWFAKNPIDPQKLETVKYELSKDATNFKPHENDTYGYGKFVAALGRLVLIAEEVGDFNTSTTLREKLKLYLAPWFYRVTFRATFLYDVVWGGCISADGWLDGGRDYGNGMYNDHHFHNGYYIYAAAVILKGDPNWEWAPRALALIRDIANPSTQDTYFPITRHKDWYNGHSWAQGLDPTYDGKNQESTSEAVNCYYGVMLYGLATGDQHMYNFGRLLLATEMRSTQKYWQIRQGANTIYPDVFAQNAIVGIIWSNKADYATFFGGDPQFVHCIQMLPFTPITEELLPKDWVSYEYGILQPALTLPTLTEEWKAYVYEDWAIIARDDAWDKAMYLLPEAFFFGNSRTNTYWWIATRPV